MSDTAERSVGGLVCWMTMALCVTGLLVLALRLKDVQVDSAPEYNLEKSLQSIRRVRTAGGRGRILDASGAVMAGNRKSFSLVCNAAAFQRRSWTATTAAIAEAITNVGRRIGAEVTISERTIRRHVNRSLSLPLVVWGDVDAGTLARFCENHRSMPGFDVSEGEVRTYPYGRLASHVIGYVGSEYGWSDAGDVKFSFSESDQMGRAGIEFYYDSYLRGVAGERDLLVDSRGFAMRGWTVTESGRGPDLMLTIDMDVQRIAERELNGLRGACAVLDPRDGAVIALASAPGFDPNEMVPTLSAELYRTLADDPGKPLLNRATSGLYAPGSTFKPVTAIAGLGLGYPSDEQYCCDGSFDIGGMTIRCSRRWGHGFVTVREALRDSCNPFFCNLGCECGTNQLCLVARRFGLGGKTGIDYPGEQSGVVPDGAWKMSVYHEKWYPGDLAQMSIGQGMLLVSPLQMARLAGAIGTGMLARPRLNSAAPVETVRVQVPERDLEVVREGMRMVTMSDEDEGTRGTGWRGASGVDADVIGKTGTAEVGIGARRRKNTWFIAYAVSRDGRRAVAAAMVVENGVSGGGTTAPKVAEVLKGIFGEKQS